MTGNKLSQGAFTSSPITVTINRHPYSTRIRHRAPMPATARRALVIGGSLAGLLSANLLLRAGWDVEVFEQSSEELTGRGAGIISHPALFESSLSVTRKSPSLTWMESFLP